MCTAHTPSVKPASKFSALVYAMSEPVLRPCLQQVYLR